MTDRFSNDLDGATATAACAGASSATVAAIGLLALASVVGTLLAAGRSLLRRSGRRSGAAEPAALVDQPSGGDEHQKQNGDNNLPGCGHGHPAAAQRTPNRLGLPT